MSALINAHMCVLDIDECASTPGNPFCQNGGTCTNTVGGFMCSCSSGFNGSQCQTGALPLSQVELTLWTFRFDECHRTLNCRHWQLLNTCSRIVYTWETYKRNPKPYIVSRILYFNVQYPKKKILIACVLNVDNCLPFIKYGYWKWHTFAMNRSLE